MSDPMRIRAQAQGGGAVVRVLMSHEMETGQRVVLSGEWGTAIAKNPFTEFLVKGAKAGDKVAVSWVDNRGDKRSDEAVVA